MHSSRHIFLLERDGRRFTGAAEAYGSVEQSSAAIASMKKQFDTRRKLMHSRLNKLKGVTCIEPLGAFYCFPNVSGVSTTQARTRRTRDKEKMHCLKCLNCPEASKLLSLPSAMTCRPILNEYQPHCVDTPTTSMI